jgi:hypothetical protein
MLNSGNNDREQNWLLLSPRAKRAQSDWRATVTLGCPRCSINGPKSLFPRSNGLSKFSKKYFFPAFSYPLLEFLLSEFFSAAPINLLSERESHMHMIIHMIAIGRLWRPLVFFINSGTSSSMCYWATLFVRVAPSS